MGYIPNATDIAYIALACVLDGETHPAVQEVANLGTRGNNPGNVHRELMNKYNDPRLPNNESINVPSINQRGNYTEVTENVAGVLLVHDWWACLGTHFVSVHIRHGENFMFLECAESRGSENEEP